MVIRFEARIMTFAGGLGGVILLLLCGLFHFKLAIDLRLCKIDVRFNFQCPTSVFILMSRYKIS